MMKLLSIELKKILSYSAFWVFVTLYAALLIFIFLAISTFTLPGMKPPPGSNFNYIFPNLWHSLTYIAGWFNLLLGVLVVMLITNEFTFRTVRQSIIDGWSVKEFVLAKVILIVFLALCAAVFVFIIGIFYGLIVTPTVTSSIVFAQMSFVLAYFLQALGYLSFALFMGTLVKKAALGIIFFLLYVILVERLIGWPMSDDMAGYLPFHTISGLIDFYGMNMIGIPARTSPQWIHLGFALAYSILFIAGTWLLLKKRDN